MHHTLTGGPEKTLTHRNNDYSPRMYDTYVQPSYLILCVKTANFSGFLSQAEHNAFRLQ